MERWSGKVALVTGASSGIGAAIAVELARNGMRVVGFARRVDKIEVLKSKLGSYSQNLFAVQGDISKEEDILAAFDWIRRNLGGVDVLINNAGLANQDALTSGSTDHWREMLEVNVLGLSTCTREAVKSMKTRDVEGHIIHMNSVLGHNVPVTSTMTMYSATKHAVTTLAEGLRRELVQDDRKIRVTSISPGLVKTEIFLLEENKPISGKIYDFHPFLIGQDIADVVTYVLSTPQHVQIQELTLRPTGEKF